MTGYDIIGDVHGCATHPTDLLEALGYRENDWTGAYWHPERLAIYVGDLIDRGGEQLRVLEIVKCMVDSGSAQIVMGNHEFNATRMPPSILTAKANTFDATAIKTSGNIKRFFIS